MKNLSKIIVLLFAAVLIGCDVEDPNEISSNSLSGESYVYFDANNGTTVDEVPAVVSTADGSSSTSPSSIDIAVIRSGTDFSSSLEVTFEYSVVFEDTTVFYNAGDDASDFVNFSNEGTITIPAGRTSGSITISTENDVISTGDRIITLTITGVSDNSYTIGSPLSGNDLSTFTVTVVEDDCPFDAEMMTGKFSATHTRLHSGSTSTYLVNVLQLDPDNNPLSFRIDTLLGKGWDGDPSTYFTLPLNLVTCRKAAIYEDGVVLGQDARYGDIFLGQFDAFFTGEPGPVFAENNKPVDEDDPASWVVYDDVKGTWTIWGWISVGAGSFGGYEIKLTKVEE